MSGWLDYSLQDFLLFSPETYWRLFERQNMALWPLQPIVMSALAVIVFAAASGRRRSGIAIGIGLAIGWGAAAQTFLSALYEPINWAIGYVIPVFWFQVCLMAFLGPRLAMGRTAGGAGAGIVLACIALAYPIVGLVAGRPIVQAEVAGLAPDPTALLTLGILVLARPCWQAMVLAIVPVAWLSASVATLLTMDERTGWFLLVLLAAGLVALLARRTGDA